MTTPEPATGRPVGSRARRYLLAGIGLVLVGFGAIGAVLPGLPTTIFLIGAAWCFARSCPWLSERLLGARLFRPFRPWLEPGARISRRARASSLFLMWIAVGTSATLLVVADRPRPVLAAVIVGLGGAGTWFICRYGRGSSRSSSSRPSPAPDPARRAAARPPRDGGACPSR